MNKKVIFLNLFVVISCKISTMDHYDHAIREEVRKTVASYLSNKNKGHDENYYYENLKNEAVYVAEKKATIKTYLVDLITKKVSEKK